LRKKSYMTRQQLIENIHRKGTFLCVGLDTDVKKLPPHLLEAYPADEAVYEFNKAIVDATASSCIAYKPNVAFYESLGAAGWGALARTVQYIRRHYPDQFIIADAKRGDIGNTSQLYARTFFEQLDVDALTVAPYMGEDSVKPFLGYDGKWVIVLALTSNKGAADFQFVDSQGGTRLFERVLTTSQRWGDVTNMMYVAGATQAALLADVRRLVPNHFLLVPGIGAQGGSLEEVCRYGMTADCGLIVNSSRAVIYADSTENFALRAAEEAMKTAKEMKKYLN